MSTCLFAVILGLIILICLTQSSRPSFDYQTGGSLPVDPRGKNVRPNPIPFLKEYGEDQSDSKVGVSRDQYELHAGIYEKQPSIIDRKGSRLPQWKRWAWDDPAKYPPDPQGKCLEKGEKNHPSPQVVDSRVYGLLWGGQPPRCPWGKPGFPLTSSFMKQEGSKGGIPPEQWHYPPFKPQHPTTHSITYALDTTQIGGPWGKAPCPPQGSGPDGGCPCIPGQRSIIEGDVLSCQQMRSLCNCQQCSTPQWTPSVDHPLMDPVS